MRFAVGMVLIDAPHSALNMLGIDESRPERNVTVVKKLRCGRDQYVYVSAQAWRYWWRKTLEEKFGWVVSPLTRAEKQVFTSANPIKYDDDDVFGYMRAEGDITVTRISPLKNTPLVSVLPIWNSLTEDEGYASRHEGDPVPHTTEFYSTVLRGAFSLDLDNVGRFTFTDKAGFRNLIDFDALIKDIKNSKIEKNKKKKKIEKIEELRQNIKWDEDYIELAKKLGVELNETEWIMPKGIRAKRAVQTILALKYLFGGAKQTLFLTDVTPKFVILAMFDGGINPFISDIVYEKDGKVELDEETIVARIREFSDILEPKKVFIGKDEGFMKDWIDKLKNIKKELEKSQPKIKVSISSVSKALEEFAKEVARYYGLTDEEIKKIFEAT